jgi:hypothetical protein
MLFEPKPLGSKQDKVYQKNRRLHFNHAPLIQLP